MLGLQKGKGDYMTKQPPSTNDCHKTTGEMAIVIQSLIKGRSYPNTLVPMVFTIHNFLLMMVFHVRPSTAPISNVCNR